MIKAESRSDCQFSDKVNLDMFLHSANFRSFFAKKVKKEIFWSFFSAYFECQMALSVAKTGSNFFFSTGLANDFSLPLLSLSLPHTLTHTLYTCIHARAHARTHTHALSLVFMWSAIFRIVRSNPCSCLK